MVINFNKLKLNNFGSYSQAEVDLQDKGFCIVSGQNKYKKDGAASNGSGKSTLWSAICYALTGETISGLKNNLKNIYTSESSCSVTLNFRIDSDEYEITRVSEPKSDLKIIKNGADISGKGIRESEKILVEVLPDLTKNLIASTIILGQGMPNKLSSFSPSGRKELLENLTKSDFMIEDVKARITDRQQVLATHLRKYEDSLLVNNTQLTAETNNLEGLKLQLQEAKEKDFDKIISELTTRVNGLTKDINDTTSEINKLISENEALGAIVIQATTDKAKENELELQAYMEKYNSYIQEKNQKSIELNYLNTEINKLKNIKDVCPTCGQKIPGVLIPDVSIQEEKSKLLTTEITQLDAVLASLNARHKEYLADINSRYSNIETNQTAIKLNKTRITKLQDDLADFSHYQAVDAAELAKVTYDKQNTDQYIKMLNYNISEVETKINTLNNAIKITDLTKADLLEHIAVVKKIETLVKRDFRGYLLYNIIEYLNNKAQEYSNIVFGTTELKIYLNGNSIEISYCDKLYENLSGGEKQRVDLIVQFAIRDLLQNYFNYSSNILVLDEITDNLDKIATEKIFDLISNKLKNIESVFIISHHADELSSIPIDSELQIIKEENGISRIIS